MLYLTVRLTYEPRRLVFNNVYYTFTILLDAVTSHATVPHLVYEPFTSLVWVCAPVRCTEPYVSTGYYSSPGYSLM